jgi:serpin B
VDLRFPPFTFASSLDLTDPVEALGVTTAFSGHADFSRATERGARLGSVRQSALVRVDEQGTVAAAITTVIGIGFGQAFGVEPQPRLFRVDRPFLFVIRHRPTGTILFMGRVEDPTK